MFLCIIYFFFTQFTNMNKLIFSESVVLVLHSPTPSTSDCVLDVNF